MAKEVVGTSIRRRNLHAAAGGLTLVCPLSVAALWPGSQTVHSNPFRTPKPCPDTETRYVETRYVEPSLQVDKAWEKQGIRRNLHVTGSHDHRSHRGLGHCKAN